MSDEDLYSVLCPIVWLCQVTGIFSLSLKGPHGKKKYSTNFILIIYGVMTLVLSITGLLTWTEHVTARLIRRQRNRAVGMGHVHSELALQAFSMLVMITSAVITRDKFADAIDTLSSQDTLLRKLGTRLDYAADLKRCYERLGIKILGIIMLVSYQLTYEFNVNSRYPQLWAAWVFPNVIRIVSSCLYSDVILALRQRLAALNEHLIKMIEETKYLSPETVSTDCSDRIRSMARIHGALFNAALNMNKSFGLNMIVGVVCAMKMLTMCVYYIIQTIEDSNDINWMPMAEYVDWGLISSVHIVYLVTACNLAKNQASLTGKLIHKFQIIEDDSTPFGAALRSFSLQLYHQRIEFTAAGVFPLDATLFQSIVGAVTTFLIILIQI